MPQKQTSIQAKPIKHPVIMLHTQYPISKNQSREELQINSIQMSQSTNKSNPNILDKKKYNACWCISYKLNNLFSGVFP